MTVLLTDKLKTLSGVLADLKDRVRVALASEVAGAVSAAVREVVQAVLAGRRADPVRRHLDDPYRRTPPRPWRGEDHDPWDDDRDQWADDRDHDNVRADPDHSEVGVPSDNTEPPGRPAVTAAVAAGAQVARWWLARSGTLLGAVGLGLAVAVAGLAGGPAARIGLGVLATVAELVSATDALGGGAAALAVV